MTCDCDAHGRRLSRRDFVRLTAGASAALGLSSRFGFGALPTLGGQARAAILLWMAGGPSQIDTFDPKPGRITGGPFKAIDTAVSGLRISEHLPRLAKQFRHISLIRSLTTRDPNHLTADVGILIGERAAWRRGYGREAWIAVCRILLESRGLQRGCHVGQHPLDALELPHRLAELLPLLDVIDCRVERGATGPHGVGRRGDPAERQGLHGGSRPAVLFA
jgi:hypothetical protein